MEIRSPRSAACRTPPAGHRRHPARRDRSVRPSCHHRGNDPTTWWPFFFASTIRLATRLMLASATEEPPYFCTTKAHVRLLDQSVSAPHNCGRLSLTSGRIPSGYRIGEMSRPRSDHPVRQAANPPGRSARTCPRPGPPLGKVRRVTVSRPDGRRAPTYEGPARPDERRGPTDKVPPNPTSGAARPSLQRSRPTRRAARPDLDLQSPAQPDERRGRPTRSLTTSSSSTPVCPTPAASTSARRCGARRRADHRDQRTRRTGGPGGRRGISARKLRHRTLRRTRGIGRFCTAGACPGAPAPVSASPSSDSW